MRKLLLTVSFLILTVNLFAETNDSKPFVIGETITLKSDILNEDRQILISKPAGYDQSSMKYPVMYLLDGNAHFHHTTGIIQFLWSIGNMPQMIVVAIPNIQRTRDLTPATSDTSSRLQNAGGAMKICGSCALSAISPAWFILLLEQLQRCRGHTKINN